MSESTAKSLSVESVAKVYPTRGEPLVVLRDVSLSLQPGEVAVIMGPSGCGKSTLLNIIGTLDEPTGGTVRLGDCDPFALSESQLARYRNEQVGFVFQDHHLLPHLSVLENVLLPTLAHRGSNDGVARAKNLLDRVGLSDRLEHRPAELSGGERQRTALARALINAPPLLLADEPTGNLDRASAERIGALLLELQHAEHVILVVVTHSPTLAARFDRQYELTDGVLAVS